MSSVSFFTELAKVHPSLDSIDALYFALNDILAKERQAYANFKNAATFSQRRAILGGLDILRRWRHTAELTYLVNIHAPDLYEKASEELDEEAKMFAARRLQP